MKSRLGAQASSFSLPRKGLPRIRRMQEDALTGDPESWGLWATLGAPDTSPSGIKFPKHSLHGQAMSKLWNTLLLTFLILVDSNVPVRTNQPLTLVIYIFTKFPKKLAKQSVHDQIHTDSNCTIVLQFISGCYSNTFPRHLRKPPKHSLDGQAMTNWWNTLHILSSCPGCTWIPNGLLPSYKSGCFSVILLFTKSPPKILPEVIYLGVCTLITSSFAVAWTSKNVLLYPYTVERRDALGCTSPATKRSHSRMGCTI